MVSKMISNEELIADIREISRKLGVKTLSRRQYLQNGGKYSDYHLHDGGRTWLELCHVAGIKPDTRSAPVSDKEYFRRLREAVKQLGRYPKSHEKKKFGLNFKKSRWSTLKAFFESAVGLGEAPNLFGEKLTPASVTESEDHCEEQQKAIPRNKLAQRKTPPIPLHTKRKKWERVGLDGFPYAPQDESGVVAIFAILCARRVLNWQILEMNGGKGIDAKCYDHDAEKEIRVELKYILSKNTWNHDIEQIDYVVCWENRWRDFTKPVKELKKILDHAES